MNERLIVTICAGSDSFAGYAENCEGIYAAGDSVAQVKKDLEDAIRIYKDITPRDKWAVPIREDWPVEFHYDVQSMLRYYQGIISNAALERLTGINKKQLWNYANGVSRPRKETSEKIEQGLHKLGAELSALRLT